MSTQTTTAEPPDPGMARLRRGVDFLSALLGLGAYFVVFGAVQQWTKIDAAGLPGDVAIDAFSVREYGALGARTLAVIPVAFAFLIVLVLLADARRGDGGTPTVVVTAGKLFDFLPQALAVLAGAYGGLSWSLVTVSVAMTAPFLEVQIAVAGLIGAVPFVALALLARWRRWPLDLVPGLGRLRLPYVLGHGALIVLAIEVDQVWLAYGAAAAVCAPYIVLAVRNARPAEAPKTSAATTAPGRFDLPTALVLAMLVGTVVMPVWAGLPVVAFAALLLIDHVTEQPDSSVSWWVPKTPLTRVLALSAIAGVAAFPFVARTPQRFDRVAIDIGGETAHAALLGRTSSHVLLGACVRDADKTSGKVEMLRVPRAWIPADRVTTRKYVFYQRDEPTLATGFLRVMGYPAFRPPSLDELLNDGPPPHVCGDSDVAPDELFDRLRDENEKAK